MSEHPKDRPWEPEDPLDLNGAAVAGDPAIMLACLVEEYARMGMSGQQIQELFDRPFFRATHSLKLLFGEAELQRRIGQTLARCGVLRVTTGTTRTGAAATPPCAFQRAVGPRTSPLADGSGGSE